MTIGEFNSLQDNYATIAFVMQVMVEEVSFFSYGKYEAYQYRPAASRQRKNEHWQITEGIRRSSPHYS